MDKYWYPDITREEAIELLRKCIAEVKLRESASASRDDMALIVLGIGLAYQFTFNAVVIDKEGVSELPL
jgi:20S proteasome alpha/beta subunit